MTSIVLDTTIADLFRKNGVHDELAVTMYCVFGHMDLHPEWPAEKTYPEDEEPVPYGASDVEKDRLRRIILGLKVVKRAFVVGNMKTLFFKPNVTAENVDRVFMRLPQQQRPQPLYVDLDAGKVREQLLRGIEGHKLLFWRPQGWMDEHDCLVKPALGYEINSKKFLITSGIRTPKSTIVNVDKDEVKQMLEAHELPFVVKLPLAGCGFGTYLVTTESRRTAMLKGMSEYTARGGAEVLLSDYIDLVDDLSVHLFVGPPQSPSNKHNPTILGTTIQNLTGDGHWTGGSIDYTAQERFNRLLDATIRDTTSRLPDSYIGWCGLDIVVDRGGGQWVVDLNARFTGSMPLCLLSTHFSKKLGLNHAEFATFKYKGNVQTAYDALKAELDDGSIVVNAVVDIDHDLAAIDLVWGGRDKDDLREKATYIQKQLGII